MMLLLKATITLHLGDFENFLNAINDGFSVTD